MEKIEIREIVLIILSYSQEHEVDVLTAYEHVTEFLTHKRQPYSFKEVKEYIFENPGIQAFPS